MASLTTYDAERYSLEPPIKIEPNRTPPHMYSPQGHSYTEAQQQWPPLEPMLTPQGHHQFGEAGWGAQYPAPPYPSPSSYGGVRSPLSQVSQGSPLGALSPHHNLQSPMAPTQSPLGPTMSPGLAMHPQPPPSYQMPDAMDTGSAASLSALLNQDVGPALQHELFSLPSFDDKENLSDSLRQLSTNDLFRGDQFRKD